MQGVSSTSNNEFRIKKQRADRTHPSAQRFIIQEFSACSRSETLERQILVYSIACFIASTVLFTSSSFVLQPLTETRIHLFPLKEVG